MGASDERRLSSLVEAIPRAGGSRTAAAPTGGALRPSAERARSGEDGQPVLAQRPHGGERPVGDGICQRPRHLRGSAPAVRRLLACYGARLRKRSLADSLRLLAVGTVCSGSAETAPHPCRAMAG